MFPLNNSQIGAGSAETVLFQAGEDFDFLAVGDAVPGVLRRLTADFENFLSNIHPADLAYYLREFSADHLIHDYWMTRNRHAVGFLDRNLGKTGERLTVLAERDSEYSVFLSAKVDTEMWDWE